MLQNKEKDKRQPRRKKNLHNRYGTMSPTEKEAEQKKVVWFIYLNFHLQNHRVVDFWEVLRGMAIAGLGLTIFCVDGLHRRLTASCRGPWAILLRPWG